MAPNAMGGEVARLRGKQHGVLLVNPPARNQGTSIAGAFPPNRSSKS